MSETIDLNQKYQKFTVKSQILGSGIFCVAGSMFNLLALYDYSKLSSKVDNDVKGMLSGFILAVVGNVRKKEREREREREKERVREYPFHFYSSKKKSNSLQFFLKTYLGPLLMISGLFGFIYMVVFHHDPEMLGSFGESLVKRKKYYSVGYLGSEISMIFNVATFGGLGWMFFRISFFNPTPPPRPVRVVRRRRSVQKNVASGGEEGDDDSSE
ncbi:hypothetical protein CAEBREN_18077 [Caenorhabditis brenneri]|uniref:Uncharacterized protein n=1 Tax=Caenorhabditis brenneri TaxID=135651 RepID=G0N3T1_CAEBE|nr:hypothetical protein CAEBREN_18077 [Caenorhabditis brenneri]